MEVGPKSWATLCARIESSIVPDGSFMPQEALEMIQEWERLLKFLRIPTVVTSFQSMIPDPNEQLNLIRNRLAQETGNNLETDASDIPSIKEKLDDEEEASTGRKKPSLTTQQAVVATVRKILKQYTLFFQGNMRGSSKTD